MKLAAALKFYFITNKKITIIIIIAKQNIRIFKKIIVYILKYSVLHVIRIVSIQCIQ